MAVDFDLASQITKRAIEQVRAGAPFESLFHTSLDILAVHHPSDLWDRYREVDLDAEVRSTVDAIDELLRTKPCHRTEHSIRPCSPGSDGSGLPRVRLTVVVCDQAAG